MTKELSKGFTGIEINGVRFSNISEMLQYMGKQRERIAELEKACDETQELLDKQIEATYKLDKENAELKDKLNKIERKCKFNFVDLLHDVENESKQEEQLTKAKEIIEKVAKMYRYSPRVEEIIAEAEQFLKYSEVEK